MTLIPQTVSAKDNPKLNRRGPNQKQAADTATPMNI